VWRLGLGLFEITKETKLGFLLPSVSYGVEVIACDAFYRAMALLVVASPCALVLSIPSAILAGIAWGAKHGALFRGGSAIEELAQIDTIALDKTGTLALVIHESSTVFVCLNSLRLLFLKEGQKIPA
jgi:P-type E1-E2 ATPase